MVVMAPGANLAELRDGIFYYRHRQFVKGRPSWWHLGHNDVFIWCVFSLPPHSAIDNIGRIPVLKLTV